MLSSRHLVIASLLTLTTFIVYLLTLAPDVLPGDSGEFQMAAPLLTIVHPTGYPLYLLLAKLFTLIPIGTIAYRVNLFSAVCGALSVGAFYFVASHIPNQKSETANRNQKFAALVASLLLAFTPTFWAQATQAEVYALNSLFVIMLIGLTLTVRHPVTPSPRHPVTPSWSWLALTLGLSLAHHRSILLMLPALAIYLYPFTGLRRVWRRALLLLVLPLVLYLYTPLRYDATPYAHIKLDERHIITSLAATPPAFLAHALGSQFGGALRWDDVALERLLTTPQRIVEELGGWFSKQLGGRADSLWAISLGSGLLLGVVEAMHNKQWRWLASLSALVVVYALFNATYRIGDIADFYTPIYIVCALLLSHGSELVMNVTDKAKHAKLLWYRVLAFYALVFVGLLCAVWVTIFVFTFTLMQQRFTDSPRAQWQRWLQDAPRDAILISNDRDELTPLYYLQLVEGTRSDLTPLFPLISPNFPHIVPLTAYALETARPVYFIKPMDGLDLKFRTEPQGSLVRVLGAQDTRPALSLVRESASLKFIGWSHSILSLSKDATRPSQFAIMLFWQASTSPRPIIKTYVHVFVNGQRVAQSDHIPGGDFYPSSQWATGEVLRDTHILTLPATLQGGEAVQLVAGAYLLDGGRVEGVERIELGVVKVGE